jgi:hypothetical protein
MQSIPITGIRLGCSSGRKIQLNTAPKTGIMNFHTFKPDTLIPGLCKRINQRVNDTADRNDNQIRAR